MGFFLCFFFTVLLLADSYFINANHYSVKKIITILFTFDKGQKTNTDKHGNTGKPAPDTPLKTIVNLI